MSLFDIGITFILLGILIYVHEFGHFIVAKLKGVRVERFCLGFGPELISFTRGDTRYGINAIPFGGFIKLSGENPEEASGHIWEFTNRSIADRAAVIASGPIFNYIFAFLLFSAVIYMSGEQRLTARVGGVVKAYPAEAVGIMAGDMITAIDGEAVTYWDEVTELIRRKDADAITIAVDRDGEALTYQIVPKLHQRHFLFVPLKPIAKVGIMFSDQVVTVRHSFIESCVVGGQFLWNRTVLTLRFLGAMVTGGVRVKDSMVGMLGIFYHTSEVVTYGFDSFIRWMALLSMSLAIFNLLPIPVLDGGHLFFLLIEAIRRKPLSIAVQEKMTAIGLWFLMGFMVFVTYNDFTRYFWEKIITWWQGR